MTTAVVDSGLSNLDSIARALEVLGADPVVTSRPEDLVAATRIVLPGVGAFPDAMRNLAERGLVDALRDRAAAGVPLLGVCLGMQLLARSSTEVAPTEGLGLIDADVVALAPAPGERIPHIGWNEVHPRSARELFDGVPPGSDFYFVHSYQVVCDRPDDVIATTPYGASGAFVSVVARDNVAGVQFHPEKSQQWGQRLLRNFVA